MHEKLIKIHITHWSNDTVKEKRRKWNFFLRVSRWLKMTKKISSSFMSHEAVLLCRGEDFVWELMNVVRACLEVRKNFLLNPRLEFYAALIPLIRLFCNFHICDDVFPTLRSFHNFLILSILTCSTWMGVRTSIKIVNVVWNWLILWISRKINKISEKQRKRIFSRFPNREFLRWTGKAGKGQHFVMKKNL